MKNIQSVSFLTEDKIKELVSKEPGIYRWWFDVDAANFLLAKLSLSTNDPKIQKRSINGVAYYALYFGISKDLRSRIEWHTLQKHTDSAVKHGTLSTLRQTLSALMDKDMSKSENDVNDFMRQHCYWEWEENTEPKSIEKNELSSSSYYYPLNIQENRSVPKDIIKCLKAMRKQHKK